MLRPDPRAYRVALLADAIANEQAAPFDVLGMLATAEFGIVVLPPADFVVNSIDRIVEYVVDDLLDYHRNGYRVVVIGSSAEPQFGTWSDVVTRDVERRGAAPFETFDVVGSSAQSFQEFLDASEPPAVTG